MGQGDKTLLTTNHERRVTKIKDSDVTTFFSLINVLCLNHDISDLAVISLSQRFHLMLYNLCEDILSGPWTVGLEATWWAVEIKPEV